MLGRNFYSKSSGLDQRLHLGLREMQRIYWPRHCGGSVFDPLAAFLNTGKYRRQTFIVPDSGHDMFGARKQWEDQLSVRPGSFLISISAHATGIASVVPLNDDFVFSIEDKANAEKVCSSYMRYGCVTPAQFGLANGAAWPNRIMPFIVPAPWMVRAPGLILVKVVNMRNSANQINLALTFVEPIG